MGSSHRLLPIFCYQIPKRFKSIAVSERLHDAHGRIGEDVPDPPKELGA